MITELKKQKIKEGAEYLKSRYDYINKIDGIKTLIDLEVGIDLQIALKS